MTGDTLWIRPIARQEELLLEAWHDTAEEVHHIAPSAVDAFTHAMPQHAERIIFLIPAMSLSISDHRLEAHERKYYQAVIESRCEEMRIDPQEEVTCRIVATPAAGHYIVATINTALLHDYITLANDVGCHHIIPELLATPRHDDGWVCAANNDTYIIRTGLYHSYYADAASLPLLWDIVTSECDAPDRFYHYANQENHDTLAFTISPDITVLPRTYNKALPYTLDAFAHNSLPDMQSSKQTMQEWLSHGTAAIIARYAALCILIENSIVLFAIIVMGAYYLWLHNALDNDIADIAETTNMSVSKEDIIAQYATNISYYDDASFMSLLSDIAAIPKITDADEQANLTISQLRYNSDDDAMRLIVEANSLAALQSYHQRMEEAGLYGVIDNTTQDSKGGYRAIMTIGGEY